MIKITRAQPEDVGALKAIALASKAYWGYPVHRMAQWAQTSIIIAESITVDRVYKACSEASTVGWYRLLTLAPIAILEDLWVLPAFIGQGIGRMLFQHAVEQAQAARTLAIELDADPNAAPFYAHMGCQIIGESLSEWGRAIPRLRYNLPANVVRSA